MYSKNQIVNNRFESQTEKKKAFIREKAYFELK